VAKQWEVLKWLVQNRVAGDVTGGISEDLSRILRLHRAETIETNEVKLGNVEIDLLCMELDSSCSEAAVIWMIFFLEKGCG
jgi:hypothetical protein